jgi:hypothetical protein
MAFSLRQGRATLESDLSGLWGFAGEAMFDDIAFFLEIILAGSYSFVASLGKQKRQTPGFGAEPQGLFTIYIVFWCVPIDV